MPKKSHGLSGSVEYKTWAALKSRCLNKNNTSYRVYGGRGITVCKKWKNSFEAFLKDMGNRPDGMSIDRINNDGNYEPGNCRWATWEEQLINRRDISITRGPATDNPKIINCPSCGYQWISRVITPRACPRCKHYLPVNQKD